VRKLCFWISVALFAVLPALAANIVTNPGFEDGFNGWTTQTCTDPSCGVTGPTGWSVRTLDPHTGLYAADTGCVGVLCLDPVVGEWIGQTLATLPSTTYSLTFWMDPAGSPNGETVEFDVFWNGTLVAAFPGAVYGYQQYTVSGLVASSTLTDLKFYGRSDPYFVFLDDVDVEAVPEPLTFVLSGLGLGLLGLLRAKRVC
jgi:hypothetical protein